MLPEHTMFDQMNVNLVAVRLTPYDIPHTFTLPSTGPHAVRLRTWSEHQRALVDCNLLVTGPDYVHPSNPADRALEGSFVPLPVAIDAQPVSTPLRVVPVRHGETIVVILQPDAGPEMVFLGTVHDDRTGENPRLELHTILEQEQENGPVRMRQVLRNPDGTVGSL